MSRFRNVWAKALEANQRLALKRPGATAEFDRLIFEYPRDGMIFYERGEAFEYIADLARAEADYRTAAQLFPLAHWKAVAERGVARIESRRVGRSPSGSENKQWDAFHLIHTVPHAPHEFRRSALSAIQRIDSEPGTSAPSLRLCMDEIVSQASCERRTIPASVLAQVHEVRKFGNRGAHEYSRISQYDVNRVLEAFMGPLTWARSELWTQMDPKDGPTSVRRRRRRV